MVSARALERALRVIFGCELLNFRVDGFVYGHRLQSRRFGTIGGPDAIANPDQHAAKLIAGFLGFRSVVCKFAVEDDDVGGDLGDLIICES